MWYFLFRLTRVRYKASQSVSSEPMDTSKNIVLFEDYVAIEKKSWKIIRVQMMINKANKKKIEYKNPLGFTHHNIKNIELLCLQYQLIHGNKYIFNGIDVCSIPGSDVLCHINLAYDEIECTYSIPEAERDVINCEITKLGSGIQVLSREAGKSSATAAAEINFDGRFTETVAPSASNDGNRRSKRVRTVKHFLN